MHTPDVTDFEAEFHSVLRNRDGELVDVTPDMNPKRVVRRIILEPRMTADVFEKYNFATPENICTKTWDERTALGKSNPDFFEELKMLRVLQHIWS